MGDFLRQWSARAMATGIVVLRQMAKTLLLHAGGILIYRASATTYGDSGSNGRRLDCSSCSSSRAVIVLMIEALNSCPHNSSVIAATFRALTPCTYIWASDVTSAFSLR